jgi:hypothetical protein
LQLTVDNTGIPSFIFLVHIFHHKKSNHFNSKLIFLLYFDQFLKWTKKFLLMIIRSYPFLMGSNFISSLYSFKFTFFVTCPIWEYEMCLQDAAKENNFNLNEYLKFFLILPLRVYLSSILFQNNLFPKKIHTFVLNCIIILILHSV